MPRQLSITASRSASTGQPGWTQATGAAFAQSASIATHASLVFLAGRRAYKLKRAVKYPYLDFSTVERRRAACTAELQLNRRTAPQLYLEVRALSRLADGGIVWGRPEGERAADPID